MSYNNQDTNILFFLLFSECNWLNRVSQKFFTS